MPSLCIHWQTLLRPLVPVHDDLYQLYKEVGTLHTAAASAVLCSPMSTFLLWCCTVTVSNPNLSVLKLRVPAHWQLGVRWLSEAITRRPVLTGSRVSNALTKALKERIVSRSALLLRSTRGAPSPSLDTIHSLALILPPTLSTFVNVSPPGVLVDA